MPAAAWAVPLATSVIGAAGSSSGGKKAAKGSKPDIPDAFKPALGAALGVLQNRLSYGAPSFLGPTIAGQGGVLGPAGQAGVNDAFNAMHQYAQSGLSPEILKTIQQTTDPFYADLRKDLIGGSREATASRFFGTGSAQQEMDTLRRFEGDRAAASLPLALQAGQQQLGAAGMLLQLLGGDFNARQPEAFIPMLANLMGQSPMYTPPTAPNFGMVMGSNMSSLAQSPGFLNWLMQTGGGSSGANYWGSPAAPGIPRPNGTVGA